ncbi:MAG: Gfo/Idh/MocA family oxidoreductase [Bacteroidales bacterium]|nr:Gfo/Idh/MocA family oxidoreductase [Bacteroidales bacterium]
MNLKLGIIGAGSFSMFSVEAFLQNDHISVAGVFDVDRERAAAFASKYDTRIFSSLDEMLGDVDINLIYISTPPNLHYEQSKSALLAGKHVICEKPAALEPSHAVELYEIAEKKGLLYVVNLMQRYNPLYQKVSKLIESKLLGEFLHGYFENYASDEALKPGHWMWDPEISGGIFIEHAVHFFDMFEGWLGKGTIITSQKVKRPGIDRAIYSRVQSVVLYAGGLVNLYHGFDQPKRMDRQELRLLFERGEVTLHEWVPVRMNVKGLITNKEELLWKELFPGALIEEIEKYDGKDRIFHGNFKEYDVDKMIHLEYGKDAKKEDIYKVILREMIADQVKWIHNRGHKRVITGLNGVNSLKMAWESEKKAQITG